MVNSRTIDKTTPRRCEKKKRDGEKVGRERDLGHDQQMKRINTRDREHTTRGTPAGRQYATQQSNKATTQQSDSNERLVFRLQGEAEAEAEAENVRLKVEACRLEGSTATYRHRHNPARVETRPTTSTWCQP